MTKQESLRRVAAGEFRGIIQLLPIEADARRLLGFEWGGLLGGRTSIRDAATFVRTEGIPVLTTLDELRRHRPNSPGNILNVGVAGFELISGHLPYDQPLPERADLATVQLEVEGLRVFRVGDARRGEATLGDLARIYTGMRQDMPRIVEAWGVSRQRGTEEAVNLSKILKDQTDKLGRTIVQSLILILQTSYFNPRLERKTSTRSGSRWGRVVSEQLAAVRFIESVSGRVAVQVGRVVGGFHEFQASGKPLFLDPGTAAGIFAMYDVLGRLSIGQQTVTK